MEHKLDDFFREKIKNTEDPLTENSIFDQQMFWVELQKNIDKPKAKSWWKWTAIAACMIGLLLLGVFVSIKEPKIPEASDIPKAAPARESVKQAPAIVTHKARVKSARPEKKEVARPKKELAIKVEQLAVKMNTANPMLIPAIKQDSIHFKPVMAEIKPLFKTIHVNKISDTEKPPVPQPRFKIRFAARNQH